MQQADGISMPEEEDEDEDEDEVEVEDDDDADDHHYDDNGDPTVSESELTAPPPPPRRLAHTYRPLPDMRVAALEGAGAGFAAELAGLQMRLAEARLRTVDLGSRQLLTELFIVQSRVTVLAQMEGENETVEGSAAERGRQAVLRWLDRQSTA